MGNGRPIPEFQPHRSAVVDYWLGGQRTGCVWGLDIGGANLKVACLERGSRHFHAQGQPFALWRQPADLNIALRALTAELPRPTQIAITMTGEIADCFPHKSAGVASIVEQCEMAFSHLGCPLRYYAQAANRDDGCWLTSTEAKHRWSVVAAANWHAVARFWGDYLMDELSAPGLIADLGSTTLDLTIVAPAQPLEPATDWQRLEQGRLVYTGARRSPLSMILPSVHFGPQTIPLAHELFATILDAYLMTGLLDEDEGDCATADGRPATRDHAAQRIAKMFCSDTAELPGELIQQVARQAQQQHLVHIGAALQRSLSSQPQVRWLLILGEGERVVLAAHQQIDRCNGIEVLPSSLWMGLELSRVMPAVAVAVMAP
jgi:probable H4MPT-linked C1 transfer pathway protein